MAPATIAEMPADKRRRLLETAAHEFAMRGYQGASLNRTIDACGMSKSSFYHFIGSKKALYNAVIEQISQRLVDSLAIPEPAELEGPEFWAKITRLLCRLLAISATEPWAVDLGRLFYLHDVPTATRDGLRRANKAIEAWLVDALKVGRRCGAVREDLPLALQANITAATLWVMDRWELAHTDIADSTHHRQVLPAQLATLRRMLEPGDTSTEPAAGRQ